MLSVKIGQYHPSLEDSFVNTIQTLKKDDPLIPVAVVAPTNWMLNRLQERLVMGQDATPGSRYTGTSFMNISFMNFYVFASEICRRSGADVGQIVRQSAVYEYLIAGLLKQHTHGEPLFKNVQSLPALARSLYQVIQDLADANVHSDSVKEAIKEGFIEGAEIQKLNGVISLYDLFKQKLGSLNISHYADVYHLAASCVQESKFLKNFKYILAYGFYDLTGVEQDFFGEIFRHLPTTLFIPYQKKHPSFGYVKPFFESFVLGLARDVEELPPVTGFSCLMNSQFEDNAHVPEFQGEIRNLSSTQIGDPESEIQNPDNTQYLANMYVINASGKRDEVWTVAKEILQLAGAGYKMEEIGVVARSLEPYTNAINKIFQENYIPFTTSTHEPLERYPLVKVIRQILLLKREDYYRPIVVELLNSPYFKTPAFDHKGVTPRPDLWDILSRRLGIRGGIECWLSRLEQAKSMEEETLDLDNAANMSKGVTKKVTVHPHLNLPHQGGGIQGNNEYSPPLVGGDRGGGDKEGVESVFSDEEETGRRIRIPLNQIEFLEKILCKLSTDLSSLPEKASWAAMSRSIARFLQTYINISSEGMNPEDQKRDQLIINKIWELLHTFCTLDCLNEEVTQDQFVDTLLDACRQEGLPVGMENDRGVKVLDAMSARGIPFRALFILGLNEKVFPRAISEEPFMRDHIRRKLSETLGNFIPEKLRGFEEERLLFYFLLNAARERLYLLYERSDEAGKPKVQSHYLMDMLQKVKNISTALHGHDQKTPLFPPFAREREKVIDYPPLIPPFARGDTGGCNETFQTWPHEKGEKKRNDFQDHSIYVPRGIKDKLFGKEISLLTPKEVGIRMALDKIDPAYPCLRHTGTSFITALGINPVLFARSQLALGFIEGYEHSLTAYDGVVGDMSQWWEKRVCRGISPTTLEVFGICPFKFFMGKVLELESLEEPEKIDVIAAVDLGSLYHSILRDFYSHLIEKGYFYVTVHPHLNLPHQVGGRQGDNEYSPPLVGGVRGGGELLHFYKKTKDTNPIELLHGIAQKYFTDIEQQIPIPYPILWENKKEEILDYLTKFVTWDMDRIEQTGYIPTYLEKKAHLSAQDELVKLISVSSKQDKASELTFKGKIDRIDLKSMGNTISFRVVDYKSGKYSKENLLKPAIRGQKLQLPFYIVMAERLLSEEIKRGHIPQSKASMENASFVYIAQDVEDKKGQKGTPEKTIKEADWKDFQGQCWETVKEFLSYIREGMFPISPTEDAQKCEWCEFATVCRRGHQPQKFRLEQDARLKKYRGIGNLNISKKSNKS